MKRIVGVQYEDGMVMDITVDGIVDDTTTADDKVTFQRIHFAQWKDNDLCNTCTNCGKDFPKYDSNGNYLDFYFCPNCGARMED